MHYRSLEVSIIFTDSELASLFDDFSPFIHFLFVFLQPSTAPFTALGLCGVDETVGNIGCDFFAIHPPPTYLLLLFYAAGWFYFNFNFEIIDLPTFPFKYHFLFILLRFIFFSFPRCSHSIFERKHSESFIRRGH